MGLLIKRGEIVARSMELIGRDDELDALRSVLASPPGVGVIEGDAGIGKTTLLRAGIAEARARGYRVLESSATGAETRLSFSTLRDLLDDASTPSPSSCRRRGGRRWRSRCCARSPAPPRPTRARSACRC